MVKIRLFQVGKKKRRSFRIVVMDSKKKRNGRYIEKLGFLNHHDPKNSFKVNLERVSYWEKNGAKATQTVLNLIDKEKKRKNENEVE